METTKELFPNVINFNSEFFLSRLITYIGNKRSLLPFIDRGINLVKRRLNRKELFIFDGFAGSGAVARLLKYHAYELWVNDIEYYSAVINKCYLSNKSDVESDWIRSEIDWLNTNKYVGYMGKPGFIETNYAPKDDNNIQPGERVFYTNKNARIIDSLKAIIYKRYPDHCLHYFLAPLIVEASIHTNTSGVFKGFHKKNGIGWFGGKGENALERIKGEISLEYPVFSDVECQVKIFQGNTNTLIKSGEQNKSFDLTYYDPPYNQHPYGSNYFMLNFVASKDFMFDIQDGVSGIAADWYRSDYNKRNVAEKAIEDLIKNTQSKFILFSYNNEGMVNVERFKNILGKYGKYQLLLQEYSTYKGSRNLRGRSNKVTEYLWVLEK